VSGKQIKLFLVDGTPGGLTTAEMTTAWTGHVLAAARSDLGDLLQRPEAQRTGVYLLLGPDQGAVGDTLCYVGEADVVADRLRAHHREKDFWTRVVVITSKDTNLTKSHGRYLESRLITIATQAGRVTLENGTAPPIPGLPEADQSDMDYFVSQLQIVLPVLGVDAFRVRVIEPRATGEATAASSPTFKLQDSSASVNAMAQQVDGEFIVLKDSQVIARWPDEKESHSPSTRKAYASYRAQHQGYLDDGSIVVENGVARVARDIVFSSPSAAGAVIVGRACNGRKEWVGPDATTFAQWESRGVQ
jgi:hypothetical protein